MSNTQEGKLIYWREKKISDLSREELIEALEHSCHLHQELRVNFNEVCALKEAK